MGGDILAPGGDGQARVGAERAGAISELLIVAFRAVEHLRSIDAKMSGPLPAAGPQTP